MGKVYLVGAGPGDPELLTLKADRLIQCADVVVYDNLVSPAILARIPLSVRRIYVGKKASRHTIPQGELNGLLVRLAQEGALVVRLKGGDPFIFGRGGEEMEVLVEAGVPCEVVPGITAASGCAAYSGFPLTHRDHAQSVTLATGHLKDDSVNLDWPALARPGQTLVFYMGVLGIQDICSQLITHGLAPDTPVAVIENGTRPDQRTVQSSLAHLPWAMAEAGITPPALVVVGSVVQLREKLSWFETPAE